MRRKLVPLLFDGDGQEAAPARRASATAPVTPSPAARRKAAAQRTPEEASLHSFGMLRPDWATIA